MKAPRWPEHDMRAAARGGPDADYREGAAICRRGHVENPYIKPGDDLSRLPDKCPKCAAYVLVGCPNCELRIRGSRFIAGVIAIEDYEPPSFCDECGSAFPWATREARIYELENLLDEEDIDEADRVVVSDNLRRLREEQALSERDQRAAWERIRSAAGDALKSPRVASVVEGLVSAAIRHQLGF
jgi:hypothetical protein